MTYDACEICPSCLANQRTYCDEVGPRSFGGNRPDGSSPLSQDGRKIHGSFFGQSSFADFALCYERNVVKVRKDAPLELLGPLGCGLQTGAGAAINALKIGVGASFAVLRHGLGRPERHHGGARPGGRPHHRRRRPARAARDGARVGGDGHDRRQGRGRAPGDQGASPARRRFRARHDRPGTRHRPGGQEPRRRSAPAASSPRRRSRSASTSAISCWAAASCAASSRARASPISSSRP